MKKSFKNNLIKSLTTIIFLVMIFAIGIVNTIKADGWLKQEVVPETTPKYSAEFFAGIDTKYREKFFERNNWINLFGVVQNGLGRNIIGNMEFVREKNGLSNVVLRKYDVIPFAHELVDLKEKLDEKQTPFLYVQMPAREDADTEIPEMLVNTNLKYQEIRAITDPAGIQCLDEKEIFEDDVAKAPSVQDMYFKTDIHATSDGEMWMAYKISRYLDRQFNVKVLNSEKYVTHDGFNEHSHKFLGNLGKSVGKYYNGLDKLIEYIPTQQSQFAMKKFMSGDSKSGSYEDVVMNGYDKKTEDAANIYWVTNYLQFGEPYYNIENHNSDGPNILFICDSLCYRTIPYLSLGCKNITIVDPRFPQAGRNFVDEALNNMKYDAVIYLHGTFDITQCSIFGG